MSWELELAAWIFGGVMLCVTVGYLGGVLVERLGERLVPRGNPGPSNRVIPNGPNPRGHRHLWSKRSEEQTSGQLIGVYACAGCDDLERRVEGVA